MSKQKAISHLNAHIIRTHYNGFDAQTPLSDLVVLDQVDSTMHYLQQHYPDSHRVAIISDSQTAGIGSYGRPWSSPPGVGIWLSYSWRCSVPITLTSLRIGYAVWKTIAPYCCEAPQLKWPNDIMYHNHKLAGIRIDSYPLSGYSQQLVIGIGLNVFPYSHLHAPHALALSSISQQTLCRNVLIANLLWQCQHQLTHASTIDILPLWQRHDALRLAYIHCNSGGQAHEGYYAGITDNGALCLERAGSIQVLSQAHITNVIRKTVEKKQPIDNHTY